MNANRANPLTASLLVVGALLVGLSTALSYLTYRQRFHDGLDRLQHDLAQASGGVYQIEAAVARAAEALYTTKLRLIEAGLLDPGRAFDESEALEVLSTPPIVPPYISQLRWIDADGMERARVNWMPGNNGRRVPAPTSLLQDKSNRYYVREALNTVDHVFYVSPIDFNIEFGQVEDSGIPTIRIATRTGNGYRAGIVVANLDLREVLSGVVNALPAGVILKMTDAEGTAFFTSETGFSAPVRTATANSPPVVDNRSSAPGAEPTPPETASAYALVRNIALLPEQAVAASLWTITEPTAARLAAIARAARWHAVTVGLPLVLLSLSGLAYMVRISQRERDHAQELAHQIKEMQLANKYRQHFLLTTNESFRNPLQAIRSLVYLLESDELRDTERAYLHQLRLASENLMNALDESLLFARLEALPDGDTRYETPLLPLIHDVISRTERLAAQRGIGLTLRFPAHHLVLNIAGEALRQSLLIALWRSIATAEENTQVTIEVGAESEENGLQVAAIRVMTRATRLPASELAMLGAAMAEGDTYGGTSAGAGAGGSGLAVRTEGPLRQGENQDSDEDRPHPYEESLWFDFSLVRYAVERAHGRLTIDNRGDAALSVTMRLPLALPVAISGDLRLTDIPLHPDQPPNGDAGTPGAGSAASALGPASHAGLRVLVADTDETTCIVARALLDSVGAEVRVATNATALLRVLRDCSDGLDLMLLNPALVHSARSYTRARIRVMVIGQQGRVYGLIAGDDPEARSMAQFLGIRVSILKPIVEEDLFDLLEKVDPRGESTNGSAARSGSLTVAGESNEAPAVGSVSEPPTGSDQA